VGRESSGTWLGLGAEEKIVVHSRVHNEDPQPLLISYAWTYRIRPSN